LHGFALPVFAFLLLFFDEEMTFRLKRSGKWPFTFTPLFTLQEMSVFEMNFKAKFVVFLGLLCHFVEGRQPRRN